jgi:hypothetical protein
MNDSEQTPQIEGLLVVEDKAPVALQLEYLLAALGCVVLGPASCSRQDPYDPKRTARGYCRAQPQYCRRTHLSRRR